MTHLKKQLKLVHKRTVIQCTLPIKFLHIFIQQKMWCAIFWINPNQLCAPPGCLQATGLDIANPLHPDGWWRRYRNITLSVDDSSKQTL